MSHARRESFSLDRMASRFCRTWSAACSALLLGAGMACSGDADTPVSRERRIASTERPPVSVDGISRFNDIVRDVPWSIQVVKVERGRADLDFTPTLANGMVLGLDVLTEQLRTIPRSFGTPVVAINGDFYQTEHESCPGDPRGLGILHGELVSAPTGSAAFWLSATNQPHMDEVSARFRATWPDGGSVPFGLNESRSSSEAVLFTARFGTSTRTQGGRELVLEPVDQGPSLPLQVNRTYSCRVREVRETGNARLSPDRLVLSLGRSLSQRVPSIESGAVIQISTSATPDLSGARMAIGGGPVLVRDGIPQRPTTNKAGQRHPRSAFGWNATHYFFVQVDGRQPGFSVGMSLHELAEYMARLGCTQAMNLDGGGSSTIWFSGRVINSPCYGHERPIANSLVVVRRVSPSTPASARQPLAP